MKKESFCKKARAVILLLAAYIISNAQPAGHDNLKIGMGFDLNDGEKFAPFFDVLNIENPLYPNYIDSVSDTDIERVLSYSPGKYLVIDGPFIDINPGSSVHKIKDITFELSENSIAFANKVHANEIIFLSTFIPQIKTASYDS